MESPLTGDWLQMQYTENNNQLTQWKLIPLFIILFAYSFHDAKAASLCTSEQITGSITTDLDCYRLNDDIDLNSAILSNDVKVNLSAPAVQLSPPVAVEQGVTLAIKPRLPAGEGPERVELVSANALELGKVQLDWLATFDNDTPSDQIRYILHAATEANFVPDSTTAKGEILDAASGTIAGLTAETLYYVKVEAQDKLGLSSWSNALTVMTAAKAPVLSVEPKVVLDNTNAPGQVIDLAQISYDDIGATLPKVGDLLISAEQETGFLRRATGVSQAAGKVTVQTEAAALDEVFDDIDFSTSIKLIDLPQQSAAAGLATGVRYQRSDNITQMHWPDTGLTLIQEDSSDLDANGHMLIRATSGRSEPIDCDGVSGTTTEVKYDGPLQVKYPKEICAEPGQSLSFRVSTAIWGDYEITELIFNGLSHPSVDEQSTNYGALFYTDEQSEQKVTKKFFWQVKDHHVDDEMQPYTAEFVAMAKEKPALCSGTFEFCKTKKIKFNVKIGSTWGSLPIPVQQEEKINKNADLTMTATATVDFQPKFITDYSKLKRSVSLLMEGPLSFKTEVNLDATASAALNPLNENLYTKKFVKVVVAGGVPIVINGTLKLDLEFKASVDGAMNITETLELGYKLRGGLEYRDGVWKLVEEATPWQKFTISGDAKTNAHVELRFIPYLEVSFYDMLTGELTVEPYLYGEAALEGHFLYQYEADGSGVIEGTDADYRFTTLELGGGIDGRFRAGLEIFNKSIVGYPSADKTDFKTFEFIKKTAIVGLPKLNPVEGMGILETDSRAIELKGEYTNVPNPFLDPVKYPNASFNLFVEESASWLVALPDWPASNVVPIEGSATDAWFKYTEPGIYTLRFAGYGDGFGGSFIRQYEDLTIDMSDNEPKNGMADAWEARWGVSDPNADPDKDGLTNLEEFRQGGVPTSLTRDLIAYYPFNGNANDESGNGHDGTVNGATPTQDRFGNDNSAYSFDGANDYIYINHNTALNVTGDYTFSFWVNRFADGVQHVITKGRDCNNSYFSRSGGQNFRANHGGGCSDGVTVGASFPINEWHHITGIIDNTNGYIKYYLDGILESEKVLSIYSTTNTYPLIIGRHFTSSTGGSGYPYPFEGMVDEVRIYKRALTESEINELYGL